MKPPFPNLGPIIIGLFLVIAGAAVVSNTVRKEEAPKQTATIDTKELSPTTQIQVNGQAVTDNQIPTGEQQITIEQPASEQAGKVTEAKLPIKFEIAVENKKDLEKLTQIAQNQPVGSSLGEIPVSTTNPVQISSDSSGNQHLVVAEDNKLVITPIIKKDQTPVFKVPQSVTAVQQEKIEQKQLAQETKTVVEKKPPEIKEAKKIEVKEEKKAALAEAQAEAKKAELPKEQTIINKIQDVIGNIIDQIPVPKPNQAPTINPVAIQAIAEESPISLNITALDPENDPITLIAQGLPNNASFKDNGNGIGTFKWTPDLSDGNLFSLLANAPKFREYNIIFSASDDKRASTKTTVTIRVNNKNQLPVVKAVGPKTVRENQTIKIDVDATDSDFDDLIYLAQDLPDNARFDPKKGQLLWTPGFDQAGEHKIRLGVTDGVSEPVLQEVVITVENQNRSPIINTVDQIDTIEDQSLDLTISITDPDNDNTTLTADGLPVWLELKEKQLLGTPKVGDAGTYQFTLNATDSSGDLTKKLITIEVAAVADTNHAPTFDHLSNITIIEEDELFINIKTKDRESDPVTIEAKVLPEGAELIAGEGGESQLKWTPSANLLSANNQQIQYKIQLLATDNKGAQNQTEIVIIVKNKNREPIFETILDEQAIINENEEIRFDLIAKDPDRDDFTMTADNLPVNALFNNLKGHGQFVWQPSSQQAGEYTFTFIAQDNLGAQTKQDVKITVQNVNRLPSILIGEQFNGTEKIKLIIDVEASDPDEENVNLSFENLPFWLEQGDEQLSGTPPRSEAGVHRFKIIATDDSGGTVEQEVTLVIQQAANHAPFLEPLVEEYTVEEEASLVIEINAQDQDTEDILSLETRNLPAGATFIDLGEGRGEFSWTPTLETLGRNGELLELKVTFIVTDDRNLRAQKTVSIKVSNTNQAPVAQEISNQTVAENNLLKFNFACSDPDSDPVFYQLSDSPLGSTLDYQTGEFTWTPSFDDAGDHDTQIFCTDKMLETKSTAQVAVTNTNRAPKITTDQAINGVEKDSLFIPITALDDDNDPLEFAFQDLPEWLSFKDGELTGTPDTGQSGNYSIAIEASDGTDTSKEEIKINIAKLPEPNHAPIFEAISDQEINEEQTLSLIVIATDPDNDKVTLAAQDLPSGATFSDLGKGRGELKWTPTLAEVATNIDIGAYNIKFIAKDDQDLTTETIVGIFVENTNQNPQFGDLDDQVAKENQALKLQLTAADSDQDAIFYDAENLPDGAVFDGTTGTLDWTPTLDQAGEYSLKFNASDIYDGKTEKAIKITVENVNREPTLTVSQTAQGVEQQALAAIKIETSDPDNEELTITIQDLPTWLEFDVNSGEITGTAPDQSVGDYLFKIFVTDSSGGVASAEINLTITPALPTPEPTEPIEEKTILPIEEPLAPPVEEPLTPTLEIDFSKLNSEELGQAVITDTKLNIEETQAQALVSFFNVGGEDFAVIDTAGNVVNLDVDAATADEKLSVIYTLTGGIIEKRDRNGEVLEKLPFTNIPEDADGLRTNAEGTLLVWYGPTGDRKQTIVYFAYQEGDSWRLTQTTISDLLSSDFKFNTNLKRVIFTELRDEAAKVSILNSQGELNQTGIVVTGDYWQLASNGDIWLLKLLEENLELGISNYSLERWAPSSTEAVKKVTFSEPIYEEIQTMSINETKNLATLIVGAEVHQISLE